MVVSGLPVRIPDHAGQIATMALDLLHQSGRFKIKHLPEVPLQLRIGLHTGYFCSFDDYYYDSILKWLNSPFVVHAFHYHLCMQRYIYTHLTFA